jgi:hypothetical protein
MSDLPNRASAVATVRWLAERTDHPVRGPLRRRLFPRDYRLARRPGPLPEWRDLRCYRLSSDTDREGAGLGSCPAPPGPRRRRPGRWLISVPSRAGLAALSGAPRACPIDHETGWRSQIPMKATSMVPRQTKSRLPHLVATARCWRRWQKAAARRCAAGKERRRRRAGGRQDLAGTQPLPPGRGFIGVMGMRRERLEHGCTGCERTPNGGSLNGS